MFFECISLQALNPPDPSHEVVFVPILEKEEWGLREVSS